jgi:hypothetical protein
LINKSSDCGSISKAKGRSSVPSISSGMMARVARP